MKVLYKFSVALLLVLIASCEAVQTQNIALNKTYTLSTSPNYKYSAPPADQTALTDGVYSSGKIWTQKTTVGWQRQPVTVVIDLGSVQPVGEISFSTLRNINVGISYPKNIYVFIGKDNDHFRYVGDAASTADNLPGGYQLKKFVLKDISESARYVSLSVVPTGNLIFCDEVEVGKGSSNSAEAIGSISRDRLKEAVDSLKTVEYSVTNLRQSVNKLQGISVNKAGKSGQDLSGLTAQLGNKNISAADLLNIKNKIGLEHASNLHSKYNASFVLEKYNPWDSLNELHEPVENVNALDYQFLVARDGVQYGAFVITNSSTADQQFSFDISTDNSSVGGIDLFTVPFVESLNFTRIPDPLVASKTASLKPGIAQLFIFRMTGFSAGSSNPAILIHSGDKSINVKIKMQVRDLMAQGTADDLNVNVWAYINYPMIRDRKEEAVKDLEAHHVNTIIIPPAILPKLQTEDYSGFKNYLGNFKKIKNLFFFMNYASEENKNGYAGGKFMSDEWKKKFVAWYQKLTGIVQQSGFGNAQIYLYPFDEVRDEYVSDYNNLISWAKKTIPGIKFFATITKKNAADNVLPNIDIAQIPGNLELFQQLPTHDNTDIWIYNGGNPLRALPTYDFYRLMAWKAYANDIKGIGFWNYADEGKTKLNLITNPLINPAGSHSVIYNGSAGEILSSRRWEAYRLGIEDYSILKLYAKKFGIEKAKAKAKLVVDNPGDKNKADSVRNEMLSAL